MKRTATLLAAWIVCLVANSASGAVVNAADLPSGVHSAALPSGGGGAGFSALFSAFLANGAVDGLLGLKTAAGVTGVGVEGGASGNEIDVGPEELITVDFNTGVQVTQIDLGVIFNGPEFGDSNEIAQIVATLDGGGTVTGIFTVTGEDTGVWTLPGATVTNFSPTTDVGGGAFHLDNPFGALSITKLAFTALTNGAPAGNDSDYTVVSISALGPGVIPEPSTLLLLGLGMGGLAAFRARRATRRTTAR